MPKAHTDWTVLPHEATRELSENLRWVQGSLPGMSLKRAMTIARLGDGRLVIHSAVALDEPSMSEIERWGEPAFLVVPNAFHRLDAPAFVARYPGLKVVAPRGGRKKIEEVVRVDLSIDDFPQAESVSLEAIEGVRSRELLMRVRSSDGVSLVFCDVVFNMDRKRDILGFLITSALGSAPGPRVSRLAKLVLVADKPVLRAQLERLADTPDLTRVIVAHEKVAEGPEAAEVLRKAATFL